MKLKFREKTYLITLILFLLFFNAGIFSLAFYSYQNNAKSAEEVCYAEERVIAEAFENDLKYFENISIRSLMQNYGEFYSQKDVYVSFGYGTMNLYSALPNGLRPPHTGHSATQREDGKRYFLITERVGNYVFTYAKDVSYLDEDFRDISVVFVVTSLGASALLAICLFLILRKLSSPLEKLRTAAGEIANGNFSSRADDSGGDEFSLLAADFNRMAEHVSEKIEQLESETKTKQQMLDNLAHEMRTPLTSIRGYAEYLRDANIDEEEKTESLEFIISESERLKQIGERLLDEAFIRENGIKSERVNLGKIIADCCKTISIKASNAKVDLTTEVSEVHTECDPLLIRLLITNLADNAIKSCRDNGKVVLGCGKTNGKAMLFVSDNGIGMTEEQLAHITEPFYRTDKSRSRTDGGTGLGLSLCARIAEAHSAELRFESRPEKGTKAFITFTNP